MSNFLSKRSRAPLPHSSPRKTARASTEVGLLAEEVVAQWLIQANCELLQRRWRCRWGELDLIASTTYDQSGAAGLIFVEVKARRCHNWDNDGLLAITAQKQAKLLRAAQLFLAEQPQWCNCPCRFDVALVRCRPLATTIPLDIVDQIADWVSIRVEINEPVEIAGYQLSLQHYLSDAFD